MKKSSFFKPTFYLMVMATLLTSMACNCDSTELAANTWTLAEYGPINNKVPALTTTDITVTFTNGSSNVNGNDGCNTYLGVYKLGSSCKLGIDSLTTTLMYCDAPNVMTQAAGYMSIFGRAASFKILSGKLNIYTPAKDSVAIYER